ncbi:MAG: magnesium transporter CorA family protein [Bacteroidales bacterium]|nr:magnesium transporter CorA family protein [Bacteroidales bacterium]
MIETINFENVRWVHVLNPSDDDYDFLLNTFGFHPLDIEDCRSANQRPKIDEYDDYYFLILHFPYFDKANRFVRVKEVKIFWGKDYIVTIGRSHWVVKNLFKDMQERQAKGETDMEDIAASSDMLLYNILDRLMVETYTLILRIGSEVDTINYDIFTKNADKVIEHISVTRKNIIFLNTTFKPQLRVFHKFESGGIKGYAEDMEEYWGNILDQYQKMFDMVEDYGELIVGLAKTFDSLQTNKTNEIMRVLTFISTIMLPLTVISGIYGMNVKLLFADKEWTFYGICGLMLVTVIGFIIYFKRKHWL